MHIGMMWMDNSSKSLQQKVGEAAAYYEKKYGRTPTLCLVNPSAIENQIDVNGITVRGYRPVLPNHFWIGIEDKNG